MKFTKMHGAGNDYVYIDCFAQPGPSNPAELARRIAHRRFGVGGDGLILIEPSDQADARMRMFNADGSEAEMCGNGLRCVAKYVYDHGIAHRPELRIETGAGVLQVLIHASGGRAERITVDMGCPRLEASEIPTTLTADRVVDYQTRFGDRSLKVTCVSMGNPHCVAFVPEASDDLVLGLGPIIETDPRFPQRTNVEFVEVLSPNRLRQRTWERGAGETWACGTGASAVCVAGVLTGRTERQVEIELLGGVLQLEWDSQTDHVLMTGPAVEVFQGEWPDADR
ncbi:MAG: diaminopimelate epimerase [Planctomycetota bacterium]|nr:MAG: diaminopimelate epimerase [Planctomycetota bacterium]